LPKIAATLVIAFEMPPERAVKARTTPRMMIPRTTPYSAIVWPAWRSRRTRREARSSVKVPFTSFPSVAGGSADRTPTAAFASESG